MRITSDGAIGIGCSTPSYRLDIVDTCTSGVRGLRINTASNSVGPSIVLRYSPGGLINWLVGTSQAVSHAFEFVASCALSGDPGVNGTTRMILTCGGQLGIGTICTSTEANLFLGAQGSIEGGQMVFQKGTSCSCATHLDNYNDSFRIMSGTNTGSTLVNMSINHTTGNACFFGVVTQISSTLDSAAKYAEKIIFAGSAFDNPLVSIYNAGSGTNAVAVVKVTVYQTAFGGQASNIQVGYATLMGQNASGTTTSMSIEYNGGIGSVGTLSWSGHTLQYQTNRASNYDSYTIKIELAGSLGINTF
jgi:hypothetical protein